MHCAIKLHAYKYFMLLNFHFLTYWDIVTSSLRKLNLPNTVIYKLHIFKKNIPCAVQDCMYHNTFSSHIITDFVWSLSNDIILSVSYDGTSRLWNVASGECIRAIQDGTGAELHSCLFHPLNNNMFVVSFYHCTDKIS